MRIRSFRNEKRKQFYFRVFNSLEKQVLRSEAYNSKAARNNGIESFKKNAPISERYERLTSSDGKFYFNIKAANHQVVATSLMFDSEDAQEEAIKEIIAYASSAGGDSKDSTTATAATAVNLASSSSPEATANADAAKEQDDYMDASFYQNSGTDTPSGFDSFQKGDNNFYYFSFKSDDGRVLLTSQGYTQESGRDNGIASVKKNAPTEKRYTLGTTDDGKFFFTLKAGNHQEIARSVDFDSEDEMKRAMGIVINGGGTMMEVTKAAAAPPAANSDDSKEQDDYMDADFYQTSGTDTKSGFDKFQKGDKDFHYFSFKSDDGKALLLSQGYTQESGRDNGIASVEKNSKIEKRYVAHTSDDGKYFFTLKAGNHQEIARSADFDSEDEMKRAKGILMNGGGSMVEVVKAAAAPAAAASKGDGMDDYRTFGFYKNSGTDVQDGWDKFYSEKNGEYYFSYKVKGEPVLISEGYTTEAARDNGIASCEKNWGIDKRYKSHETPSGRYYYTLRAGNHQEIARSKWYASADERDGGVKWLLGGGLGTMAAASTMKASLISEEAPTVSQEVVEKTIETPAPEPVEKEDDYLPCKEYEGHPVNDKVNGVAFFKHENGQFYFVVYKEDGSVRLRSEGFGSAKERDVELSGMLKNLNNTDMYETIKRGKYSMHILKDQTGREVGRSCLEKEVEKTVAPPVVETTVAATAVAAAAVSASSSEEKVVKKEKEDDYLPCKEYEGHDVNDKVNNIAFFKHENGQFYFVVYKEDGSVRLRSEGFESAKNRDVELTGVIKNLDKADMYETIKRGKYSIHILRDSTGREVGRSCLEKETEKVAAPPVVEAAAATAVAAAVVSASSSEEKVVKKQKEDDYLPCKAYEGHSINDKQNNVAFFKHENGQLYFVVYKKDGSVRLRSEGFESTKERDVELAGLLKNLDNKKMYETLTRGKYKIHILRDETGREVGRSCLETVEEKKAAPVVEVAAATAVAAAVVSASSSEEKVVKKEKEDDYLPCQEYQGHKVTDRKNNVAFFKKDGQFYFVIYKENGDVRLRSEGFKKSKRRDSELSAALKNLDNPDMYETLKRGKYSLHILKDGTGREVGRSCLETEEVAVPPPIVETVAATAAVAAAAAIVTPEPEPEIVVEKEVVAPVPVVKKEKKKKKAAVVAAAPVETAAAATAAASGGFNWMWLLPLLLLIPLFFILRGCDGCGGKATTAITAPPPVEKPVEKVIPPAAPVEKETPPPAPTCNCNSSDNIVFNIKSGAAKVLTRLGTNPEFGNSHSLDPAGFYNKLKRAANSNQRDKRFLDGIFRAMGYNNGFADANAGLFSNARISAGTVGNMGFSPKHRTIKARLNAQGKDLDAFRIKAANGCDLHFMKTCGNHFFFCPN